MLATGKAVRTPGAGTAITFISSTTRNTSGSTNIVGDRPTNLQAGDLLVACISEKDGLVPSTIPSGWTYAPISGQDIPPYVFYKYASASEPTTYTFVFSGSTVATVAIVAYRYAAFDAYGSAASAAGETVVAPTVSAVANNSILLGLFTTPSGSRVFSTPSGMSSVASYNANDGTVYVFSQAVSSGSTGTRTSTAPSASLTYGRLVTLRPGTTVGQQFFDRVATISWTVPKDVTTACIITIGGGGGGGGTNGTSARAGGGGGALSYSNDVSVTPYETLTINVGAAGTAGSSGANGGNGGDSSVLRGVSTLVLAKGGSGGGTSTGAGGAAASGTGDTKQSGGAGTSSTDVGSGGGGAAGYAGTGGAGGYNAGTNVAATAGNGGGGAGGNFGTSGTLGGGGGGGIALLGQGSDGTVSVGTGAGGGGGSGGTNGTTATTDAGGAGGAYGGGGGSANDDGAAGAIGARGAVRIIWGAGRSFPSTNTADQ